MTSWIRVNPVPLDNSVRPFLFKLSSNEFCEQFNQYFYATLYTQSVKRPLAVYDLNNPIGPAYALIKQTFQDVSGTTFTDSMLPNATTLNQHDLSRVIPYVNSVSRADLQLSAADVLEWSAPMLKSISVIRTQYNVPNTINVGVQILADVGRNPNNPLKINGYIQAVTEVSTTLGNPAQLTVFVMADQNDLLEFTRQANRNWKIITFPSVTSNGMSVTATSVNQRIQGYSEFIAALSCLQTSENLITSLSSNVGKFLYTTNTVMNSFRSMDVPTFLAN
jgi:hypothetical protein